MRTRFYMTNLLMLTAASILFSNIAAGQATNNSTAKEVDEYLKGMIKTQNFVCLGATLIKDNKIVWQNCYGYADLENLKSIKIDDIYQLASLSKTFTATAIMQLFEKGLFKLDDDVNNYLPFKVRNPNFPEKPITFRMLLTHTAGFSDVGEMNNKVTGLGILGDSPIPLAYFTEQIVTPGGKYYSEEFFSKNEPGTKYGYSNISFSLIGTLVEKITGKDFSEYCKENIFRPLDMKDTGWHLADIDTNRCVFTYGIRPGDTSRVYKKTMHFGLPGYPEGMLRTTMQDLSHFVLAYLNKGTFNNYQMLKPETVKLMLSPQGVKNVPSRSLPIKDMGLTWLINDANGEEVNSMNGFSGAIFTNALFSREHQTAVIYFLTGVSMQNMTATTAITLELLKRVKEL